MKEFVAIIIILVMTNPVMGEDISEKIEKPVKKSVEIRQMTQKEEDRWAKEKAKIQAEYKELKRERENLLAVNKKLKQEIDVHREEIGYIEEKIKEIRRNLIQISDNSQSFFLIEFYNLFNLNAFPNLKLCI